MKIIMQHDERDCGAACIAMIAAYYGCEKSLQFFRNLTNTDKEGVNVYGLIQASEKIGINAEALEGSSDELLNSIGNGSIKLPIIAHIISEQGFPHFVVIYKISKDTIHIADPGKGKIVEKTSTFFEKWTGYIVTFSVTNSFRKEKYKKSNVAFLLSFLKGQYSRMLLALIISAIIAIIGISTAFLFQTIIDNFVIQPKNIMETSVNLLEELIDILPIETMDISIIFGAVSILYLVQSGIQLSRSYLMIAISKNVDIKITLSYYYHLTTVKIENLAMRQTGEYMSRLADADEVRNAISNAALSLILDMIMTVGCGIILYQQNKKMFLITVLVVTINAIVALVYRKPVEKSNRCIMETNAVVQSYLKETIEGMETVKATTSEGEVQNTAHDKILRYIKALVRNSKIVASQEILANYIENMGKIVILWTGFGLVITGGIGIGELLTYYALLSYFTAPIKNVIELQPSIQKAFVACERLKDIFELEIDSKEGQKCPSKLNKWKISNVDFRYGNNELILSNISFEINKGEKIAIVGESGCGKPTVAKLLMRFYEPEKGEILCNNIPINELNLKELRKNIAYISQETFLFTDSIYNNLCMGLENISDEEIVAACKRSCIDEYINDMPYGYNTLIEENGMNLSGGQRQRLGIARALLRSPQLFIFDEATSNLDSLAESDIKKSVLYDENYTCVIISHKLSVAKECDRIYVMDKGRIVESGTHGELMSRNGKYRELYINQ